ncbi:MAG: hypothetical protein JWN70_1501 [Planctomycetaceae bacterium]|nr:hypothetical protein [Planctomycetaceae bacterium]
MNTALIYLLAASFGFAEAEKAALPVTTPVSSGYSAALSDVSSEGPVSDWISPRYLSSYPAADRNIIRGQSGDAPAYDTAPQTQSSAEAQTFVQGDPNQGIVNGPALGAPYQPNVPYDPFLGGGAGGYDPLAVTGAPAGLEYYDPYSRDFQYGILGAQPYRLGTVANHEVGYIFPSAAHNNGVSGNFSVIETNNQWRNSWYMPSGAIFSWKPEFDARGWSGPNGVPLPGHAYRFASDIELGAQGPGPWGFQLGFTPWLATDFDKQLNSSAYMFDGRAMLFFKPDPTLMLVGGVGYWDRVIDRVIPYAGVVWTPDEQWELRILFPKSRISVFMGDFGYGGVWLYGSAEYNVEAYQVGLSTLNSGDQVEIRDYRALIGLRSDNGFVSSFIEGGYVFDRHVDFAGKHPDFNVNDGWMIRTGIRF